MDDDSEYEFTDDLHLSSYFQDETNIIDLLKSYITNPYISKKEVAIVAIHAIENLLKNSNEKG